MNLQSDCCLTSSDDQHYENKRTINHVGESGAEIDGCLVPEGNGKLIDMVGKFRLAMDHQRQLL